MRAAFVILALVLVPAGAFADETVATAPARQSLPAAAPVAPLTAEDADDAGDGSAVVMGPCGPEGVAADGSVATKAHGFAEAGVGTQGYRHIAGGFCKPFKNGGAISVSVSQTQAKGAPYGYGW